METFFQVCYNKHVFGYIPALPESRPYSRYFKTQEEAAMTYKTSGVCSRAIEFEISDDKKVHNVKFIGGYSGNTQGVASLVEGMDAEEVIRRLEGIRCGFRPTSCPDQLTRAIKKALE